MNGPTGSRFGAGGGPQSGVVLDQRHAAGADVIADGHVVTEEILKDDPDLAVEVFNTVVAQVRAIQQDSPLGRVIQPGEQFHQRGLAFSILTDQSDALSRLQTEIQTLQPRSAAAWGELGMILFAHDLYADAAPVLGRAEQLDAADPRWPYLQGLALLFSDPEAVLPCLQRAAARAGRELAPTVRLAEALLEQGQVEEAAQHFQRVLERQPDHPRADNRVRCRM